MEGGGGEEGIGLYFSEQRQLLAQPAFCLSQKKPTNEMVKLNVKKGDAPLFIYETVRFGPAC